MADDFDPQNVSQNMTNPDEQNPDSKPLVGGIVPRSRLAIGNQFRNKIGMQPNSIGQMPGSSGATGSPQVTQQQPQQGPGLWQLIQGLFSGTSKPEAQAANPVQPTMQMPSQQGMQYPQGK